MATPRGRPTLDRTKASADASRLRSLRQTSGLSLRQVADKLRIERSTVSRWESGQSQGWRSHVPILAALYGITREAVLGETPRRAGCNQAVSFVEAAVSFVEAAVEEAQRREPRLAEAIALASEPVKADHAEWLVAALQRRGRALAAKAASRALDQQIVLRLAEPLGIYTISSEQLRAAVPHFQDTTITEARGLDPGDYKELGLTQAQAQDVRRHSHPARI